MGRRRAQRGGGGPRRPRGARPAAGRALGARPALLAASAVVVDVLDQCGTIGDLHHALAPCARPMQWITRERPKIDRVARPWLVARFIDAEAEFLFVPSDDVAREARARGAIPFDVEGVELSHDGPRCSFDAFLAKYALADHALDTIATIVRGADTARLDLAPQAPGLLAISLGLSRLHRDDHEMLRHGFLVYDALYAWCREASAETHSWNPQRRPGETSS